MTPTGARTLLRNRVYLGELRDGQNVKAEAHHDPIVNPSPLSLQARLTKTRASRLVAPGPALLAGLVRCAACGHLMTASGSSRHPLYSLRGAITAAGPCPAPAAIGLPALDEYVWKIALAGFERLKRDGVGNRRRRRGPRRTGRRKAQAGRVGR